MKKKLPTIALPKKPTYVKFAEDIDFFVLFKKINQHIDHCFLLESLGEQNTNSRYSVIGFSPQYIISAKKHQLVINGEAYSVSNPYQALQSLIPTGIISRNYAGGLVGYLNYDVINYFEPSVGVKLHPDYDQFIFGLYTDGLVHDTLTNETFYFYYTENRLDEIKKIHATKLKSGPLTVTDLGQSMTREEHQKLVAEVAEEVRAGNTFQCQLGFKHSYTVAGDDIKLYELLRVVNPSPYMYYLKHGKQKVIGASPELLFKLHQNEMETYPLAGTTKRGKSDEEDKRLARELVNDPKEAAEHKMLVDLHRNDLGRVAQFGTVKVRRFMDVKKFSHVQHISSEVAGIIAKGETMFSGLARQFPAGTLSGAPKIESIKIIDRVESEPRGPYGGALGHFGFNGDCTFAIPIRTLFINGDQAFTQASGGIVYDSTPENEYEEIQRKMAAIKQVMESFI